MAVRKHVDKKWFYDFYITDVHGTKKRVRKYGYSTKKEAQEAERLKKNGANEEIKHFTLLEVMDQFLTFNENKMKFTTLKKYKTTFKLFFPFQDQMIDTISTKQLSKWQHTLVEKDLSISYINAATRSLSTIFKFSIKHNGTKNNPALVVGGLKNNKVKEISFFTLDEYVRFDEVIEDVTFKTFFNLLYYTGLRKGEAIALKWSDIDLVNKKLTVNKTMSAKVKGYSQVATTPKTISSNRIVTIPENTIKRLSQLKEHSKLIPSFRESRFVFGFGEPLKESTIGRNKDKYCDRANLKRIKVHDFRHSHASLLINNGANAVLVAKRLGHSDIEMTLNTYSHLFVEKEDEIINLIDNL